MEYDPVTNRYYPAAYVAKLKRDREREPELGKDMSKLNTFVSVNILYAPGVDTVRFRNGVFYGNRRAKFYSMDVVPFLGKPRCFITNALDECTVIQESAHFRDWIVNKDNVIFAASDNGIYTIDGRCSEVKCVTSLKLTDDGGSVWYCSPDYIGRVDKGTETVLSESPTDTKKFTAFDMHLDTLLVSTTGNRLSVHTLDGGVKLKSSLEMKTFKKIEMLASSSPQQPQSALALSFDDQLYFVSLTDETATTTLLRPCSDFCTDGESLVLVRFKCEYTLFDISDPFDEHLKVYHREPCNGLLYTGNRQFYISLDADAVI